MAEGKGEELFEIFAGTYEEYLLGFKLVKNDNEHVLEQTIADHSHKASLRCVSAKGTLLASGGADEIIHLYHLDERREKGIISQHTGTITCLCFTSDEKHLVTASEDGSITIFRVGSWIMEKVWEKAHKGQSVNYLSIHPSNKLAFSVGNDGCLRTWNLIEGTPAFATNISKKTKRPEMVVWSCNGSTYCFAYDNVAEVYSTQSASIVNSIRLTSKVTSAIYLEEEILCLGGSGGELEAFSVDTGVSLWSCREGDIRIRCLAAHSDKFVAASSQGTIYVFEWAVEAAKKIASFESSCRITCLAVSCKCHRKEKKKAKLKKEGKVTEVVKNKIQKFKEEQNKEVSHKKQRRSWTKGTWEVTERASASP